MNKEYGVFNQKIGVYEKFSEFVSAKIRQQELLDGWVSESRALFGLTLYLYDNQGTTIQCSCDEQGEPLLLNNLKMDDLGIKKGKLYLPVYGVFNQKTGVYEKFATFVLAKIRQQELLDEWISVSTPLTLFGLTLYLHDDQGNATQCSCDEQGEPLLPEQGEPLLLNQKMDALGIKEDWFYLPVKTGQWGTVSVEHEHNVVGLPYGKNPTFLRCGEDYWISNDHTYINGLGGLRSQYRNAQGRVLIGGLGMGLITLVVASKVEVSHVIVVESNPDVIDAFRANGWDESKITIINDQIQNYTDTQGFDWILLDHLNSEGTIATFNRYKTDIEVIINHVGQPRTGCDYYTWEQIYYIWLTHNLLEDSLVNFAEYASVLHMKQYSLEEIAEYLSFYDKDSGGQVSPVDELLATATFNVYNTMRVN